MLKRQRRRFMLFALGFAVPLAGFFGWAFVAVTPPAIAMAYAAGLFAGLMLIQVAILRFAPSLRRPLDGWFAIFMAAFLAFRALSVLEGTASHIATFAVATLFAVIVAFDLINRVLPRRTYSAHATYRTRQSPYAVWAAHYPDPGLLDRHWTPALQALDLDRENPDLRHATYDFGHASMRQVQIMTQMDMHESFAYAFAPLDDDTLASGSYGVAIKEHGPWRDVTLHITLEDRPFLTWLALWLDDQIADQADHHAAQDKGLPDYSMTAAAMRHCPAHQSGVISPAALPA